MIRETLLTTVYGLAPAMTEGASSTALRHVRWPPVERLDVTASRTAEPE